MTKPWHILRVPRPKHVGNTALYEFALTEILERIGFEVYTPFRREWRYKNKFDRAKRTKKKKREFPLIVGYVFVRVDGEKQWNEFFKRGLVRFILGLTRPERARTNIYSFSDAEVGAWRETFGGHFQTDYRERHPIVTNDHYGTKYDAPDYQAFMDTFAEFEVGDVAEFRSGSLAGQQVKVTEILDTQARVMFRLFGISQEQTIPLTDLIKSAR